MEEERVSKTVGGKREKGGKVRRGEVSLKEEEGRAELARADPPVRSA